jgi:IS1 family transposase
MLDQISIILHYQCAMNKLPVATRVQILSMLCEGSSMRAITRITGVSLNTVAKLLVDAGKACWVYHDEHVRGVKATRVQCDEIWAFCYSKAKNVATAKAAPVGAGDVWTWTALEASHKMIVSFMVGGRDSEYALAFMDDLRSRLATRIQLTTDGHKAYLSAVEEAFDDVDYAQLVKLYGEAPETMKGRYSPAECTGIKKTRILGKPDFDYVSTSYVERSNLSIRMHMRRFTRLTNAHSKKFENHAWAVALHVMFYNFTRIHSTLRMSPAMAAGVSDRLWDMSDIVALIDAREEAPKRPSTYRKRDRS